MRHFAAPVSTARRVQLWPSIEPAAHCARRSCTTTRATAEAAQATDLVRRASESGCHFAPFTALANILWIAQHEPQIFEQSSRFIHQADYIVGRLTGDFSVTDYCNALKTGYDVSHECWPTWIARLAGVADRLPRVVAPGSAIGKVSSAAARETGLPRELTIVAGATDGVAAAVAAGLRVAGDYNTTLGTTLVSKGLSKKIVTHSQGLIYSHKLPGGLWLPGAASNTGAGWVPCWFPDASPQELDRVAERHLPGNVVAYPLVGRGERFPFQSRDAMTFMTPRPAGAAEFYAACLVGTALVERLGYEILDAACGTAGGEVYATGGGSRSNVWMQCRADVTRRVVHRPKAAESAFGSAILAASAAIYGSLERAVQEMAGVQRTFVPRAAAGAYCDELFARFRQELVRRKYVTDPAAS